jgi:hypothetical protein
VAPTVAAIAVLRDGTVLAAVVIALAPEIARVAAGAIGLEFGVGPGHHLRIVLVAGGAGEVAVMIEWLVRQAGVHVNMRYPGDRFVAIVALAVRNEVAWIATGRRNAIMAR